MKSRRSPSLLAVVHAQKQLLLLLLLLIVVKNERV
jgi:hypothetical protein